MVARRLLVGKKIWVCPGFIAHAEYVISCANDYSNDYSLQFNDDVFRMCFVNG